jgi:glycosyltransferase involved in cell wall biosynthesis
MADWHGHVNRTITLPLHVFKEHDPVSMGSIFSTIAYSLITILVGTITVLKCRLDTILGVFAFPQGFVAVLIGQITRRRVVLLTDGGDIDVFLRSPLIGSLIVISLRRADAVIALNKSKANHLLTYGIQARISVAFGVDTLRFGYVPFQEKQKWLILYAGRLSSEKCLGTLLKACEELHRKQIGFELLLLGDGPLRHQIIDAASQAGIQDLFSIKGYVPHAEIHEFFRKAAIFVLPSAREGVSVSLLEGMSSGCVCVASDIPDNLEVVQDMYTGITFRVNDAQDLANKLYWVISHPWMLESITRNARHKVQEEYSLQAVADTLALSLLGLSRTSA